MKEDYLPKELGKLCAFFEAFIKKDEKNEWFGMAMIGNTTYFTKHYKERDYAISELKGYLEGTQVKIQAFAEYLDNELKKGE